MDSVCAIVKNLPRPSSDTQDRKISGRSDGGGGGGANPNSATACYSRGVTLLDRCNDRKALEYFERALEYDPDHFRSWIGKGMCLILQDRYGKAKECFAMVPKDDEAGTCAKYWSCISDYYLKDLYHGRIVIKNSEQDRHLLLEKWLEQYKRKIRNLPALLYNFKTASDNETRRQYALHSNLVKTFYERGPRGTVRSAICKDNVADAEIVLKYDIHIQVRYGHRQLERKLNPDVAQEDLKPHSLECCKELKPIKGMLNRLPGKGFVLNYVSGHSIVQPRLNKMCTDDTCVMMMCNDMNHIMAYGTQNFKHKDDACWIARMLDRHLMFILGDWDDLLALGYDPNASFLSGNDVASLFHSIKHLDQNSLLDYIKNTLKYRNARRLVKLPRDELLYNVLGTELMKNSDCSMDDM